MCFAFLIQGYIHGYIHSVLQKGNQYYKNDNNEIVPHPREPSVWAIASPLHLCQELKNISTTPSWNHNLSVHCDRLLRSLIIRDLQRSGMDIPCLSDLSLVACLNPKIRGSPRNNGGTRRRSGNAVSLPIHGITFWGVWSTVLLSWVVWIS